MHLLFRWHGAYSFSVLFNTDAWKCSFSQLIVKVRKAFEIASLRGIPSFIIPCFPSLENIRHGIFITLKLECLGENLSCAFEICEIKSWGKFPERMGQVEAGVGVPLRSEQQAFLILIFFTFENLSKINLTDILILKNVLTKLFEEKLSFKARYWYFLTPSAASFLLKISRKMINDSRVPLGLVKIRWLIILARGWALEDLKAECFPSLRNSEACPISQQVPSFWGDRLIDPRNVNCWMSIMATFHFQFNTRFLGISFFTESRDRFWLFNSFRFTHLLFFRIKFVSQKAEFLIKKTWRWIFRNGFLFDQVKVRREVESLPWKQQTARGLDIIFPLLAVFRKTQSAF